MNCAGLNPEINKQDFTDPMEPARIENGICLVIKGGETSKEVISRSIDLLRNAQAHILGAVINNIDLTKKSYYYY